LFFRICLHQAANFFHGAFRSPVFVEDALAVESPRAHETASSPVSSGVGEMPDSEARDAGIFQKFLDDNSKILCLIVFSEKAMERILPSGQGKRLVTQGG